jgi:transposase
MDELTILNKILDFGKGWEIKDVKINKISKEIDIYLQYVCKTCFYSNEEPECPIYDHSKARRIRHLDMFDYTTFLNFKTPRALLSDGKARIIPLKFTDERVSFTYGFEIKTILTLELSKNKTKTASYLNTSFEVVDKIMQRAVKRGLVRRNLDDVRVASLDEKSIFDGHNYITILSDPINQRILDIIEGRTIESTRELIQTTLTQSQQENITDVTMDMWKPYVNCVTETLPNADISHDNFHISKYLNKAVDTVRKEEVKKNEELKHTKYIFIKNNENWTDNQKIKFQEINQTNLKTADAWRIKENFKAIYSYWNPKQCIHFFENWYINVLESDIKPMIAVADTLLRHLKGIVNAAVTSLSNAIAENINGKIQIVKSIARGFKSVKGYRNALLFFNGNLDLLPL